MADITEQIVREAPEIEAYKIGLLESAKGLADTPVNLPGYQVAGFNPDQIQSFDMARQGIGAYQPYMEQGAQALNQGISTTGEAANVLRGSDTRNQFAGGQQAMAMSSQAAGQLGGISDRVDPGYGMLQRGGQYTDLAGQTAGNINYQPGYNEAGAGTRFAQQQALGSSAANYAPAANLMGAGISQLYQGTGQFDPRSTAAFMNPYQQQVIDASNQEINRQRDLTAQGQAAQAVRSGAFGGSRQAVQQSELERNTAQLRNQTTANLLAQGYTQAQAGAQNAYEAGQQRNLAVGQGLGQQAALAGQLGTQQAQLGQSGANLIGQLAGQQGNLTGQQAQLGLQQAGLYGQLGGQYGQLAGQQGALAGQQANILGRQADIYGNVGQGIGQLATQQYNIGSNMAQTMGGLGSQLGNMGVQQGAMGESVQRMGQQDVNLMYNIGQQQQGLTQQGLDAQRNTELQRAYEPYQRLGFVSDIYKGAPSSQQSITAATAPVPSQFQQAAGTFVAGTAAATGAKRAGLF